MIVTERLAPGAVACSVALRHGIHANQLCACRRPGGKPRQVFAFDGTWDLRIDDRLFPSDTAERTVALWVRLDGLTAAPNEIFFIGYGDFRSTGGSFVLGAHADGTPFVSNWHNLVLGVTPLQLKRWYFIAAATRHSAGPGKDEVRTSFYRRGSG